MNRLPTIVLAALVLVASTVIAGDEGTEIKDPANRRLMIVLKKVVSDAYPDAKIETNANSFSAQFGTQKFKIHGHLMTGEILEETRDDIGPGFKGFIIHARIDKGKYQGQAAVPQTLREPYWHTFLNAYPLKSGNHIRLSISYGSRIPEEFLEAIKKAIEEVAKE